MLSTHVTCAAQVPSPTPSPSNAFANDALRPSPTQTPGAAQQSPSPPAQSPPTQTPSPPAQVALQTLQCHANCLQPFFPCVHLPPAALGPDERARKAGLLSSQG